MNRETTGTNSPFPYREHELTKGSALYNIISHHQIDHIENSNNNSSFQHQQPIQVNVNSQIQTKVVENLDDFYQFYYFNQLYQIIQHLFQDNLTNTNNSLTNYIRATLNYPDEETFTPPLLGITPFEERVGFGKQLKTISSIQPEFYQVESCTSHYFNKEPFSKPNKTIHLCPQLEILLTFGIVTKNVVLVSWILDPQHDPTSTWNQRLTIAENLINSVTITDDNILADIFRCASNPYIGGLSRLVIFQLLLSSDRYLAVIDNHIQNYHNIYWYDHLLFVILSPLGLPLNGHVTTVPMIKSLLDSGIEISFHKHIKKCIPLNLISLITWTYISQYCSIMDDVLLFQSLFYVLGGADVFFSPMSSLTMNIFEYSAIKMFKFCLSQSGYPIQWLLGDENIIKSHFRELLWNSTRSHHHYFSPVVLERSNEMAKFVLNLSHSSLKPSTTSPALDFEKDDEKYDYKTGCGWVSRGTTGKNDSALHKQTEQAENPFSNLLLTNSFPGSTDSISFQLAYKHYSPCLRALWEHGISIQQNGFRFEQDHIVKCLLENNTNNLMFLLDFLFSVPQSLTLFSPLSPLNFSFNYNSLLTEDNLLFLGIFLQPQLDLVCFDYIFQNQETIISISSLPLLFGVLSLVRYGTAHIIPLVELILNNTSHDRISLNMSIGIDFLYDVWCHGDSCEGGHENSANLTLYRSEDNSAGFDLNLSYCHNTPTKRGTKRIQTQYQNLTPILFAMFVDIAAFKGDINICEETWASYRISPHLIEIMIQHYIEALCEGKEDELHPQQQYQIEVRACGQSRPPYNPKSNKPSHNGIVISDLHHDDDGNEGSGHNFGPKKKCCQRTAPSSTCLFSIGKILLCMMIVLVLVLTLLLLCI